MKNVISFSGGKTSAYLCWLAIKLFGRENCAFVFMDTGAEHPKTYDFVKRCDEYFGLDLVYLRVKTGELGKGNTYCEVGRDSVKFDLKPYSSVIEKYGVPEIGKGCTRDLKERPFLKFCKDNYDSFVIWLGIRVDESKRAKKSELYKSLFEISDFDKKDVNDWWNLMPFNLEIPEWLGNCVFCPKKSSLKLAAAQRDEPGLYFEFIEMLESDRVRFDNKTSHYSRMYRGKMSLQQVIAQFDGFTGNEIKQRIRSVKMTDSGCCSESCEVFTG